MSPREDALALALAEATGMVLALLSHLEQSGRSDAFCEKYRAKADHWTLLLFAPPRDEVQS